MLASTLCFPNNISRLAWSPFNQYQAHFGICIRPALIQHMPLHAPIMRHGCTCAVGMWTSVKHRNKTAPFSGRIIREHSIAGLCMVRKHDAQSGDVLIKRLLLWLVHRARLQHAFLGHLEVPRQKWKHKTLL